MIQKLIFEEKSKLQMLLGYKEVELKNLTILMGPNGVGKSSLVQGLSSKIERSGVPEYYRSCGESIQVITDRSYEIEILKARQDNGKYRGYFEDVNLDIEMLFQSEGQSTMTMLNNRLAKLIEKLTQNPERMITFLIDELDSGVSFDNVILIVTFLKNIQLKFPNLQIIMTAHNYEFARSFPENTFWVPIGQYIDMREYEQYQALYHLHLIKKQFKKRDKEKSEGEQK
jgi:AAA15 family ATPase/GTPase